MNVLLISTNRHGMPMPVMPIGACIAAAAAQAAGHRVTFLDLMFKPDPIRAVQSAVRAHRPDVVGLSVRNIDNTDMLDPQVYIGDLPQIVAAVRGGSAAPVVLGGAAVGIMPEALLRRSGADWALVGDGEAGFPPFLDALANGRSPRGLPGTAWIEDGRFRRAAPTLWTFSDGRSLPDVRRWLDVRAYGARLATVPVQAKRGCPFECVYCTYPIHEGRLYRLQDPARVAAWVGRLAARGLRDIEFVDNVFNSPHEHALALCDRLAAERTGARLQTVDLNPRFVDDRLLSAMERAGFVSIGISAESAADGVLAGLRKGYTGRDVGRAARCVRRHALPCCWVFMLGGPGETRDTVRHTLRFAADAIAPRDMVLFNVGIRIYPGTAIERIARQEGLLDRPAADLLEPAFYFSPLVEREWVLDRLREAVAAHLNYVNFEAMVFPWLPWCLGAVHRLRLPPPFWRYTRPLRRGLRLLGRDIS